MRSKRTNPHHRVVRGLRLTAVASGLLALAAFVTPGIAAADAGGATTYSSSELDRAAEAVDAADVSGTAWAVDAESGTVVVLADESVSRSETARIKRGAGALSGALTIERTEGRFQQYLQGGDAIYADLGWRCSLGFNVKAGGVFYFLTAGHCTDDPYGPTPPYPLWNDGVNWIGYTQASSFPGNDYGLVRYDPQPAGVPSTVNLYNGGSQTITSLQNPFVGQSACRSGSTTGVRCGSVNGLNYTVDYGNGDIVSGLIRTNICAEPGDSGGPLYSGTIGLGLTSGGSGNCTSGGTTFFQPVVEAAQAYGVMLP
ncbi:S1 family peptidase [Streptomyces sp. NBC_01803]|uniref:S1 family peptidase n=1 Tax=Streptomyces sp. NBC_01803 TaxID=2975946 RepID=UPI002DD8C9FE|nr:S1 family peptidase [Streptomyces sp. NBC_01803]WSA44717.1 S1 family peptidase [Streptomyces sp. NBC_01803]